MEKLISVIVCTYNQEKTIARTLDAILMQQCHVPYEIVIGDDCSTDGTRGICEAYASRHPDIVRHIVNDHNKGVLDNYFDCLMACRGEYIADCAGDDFWIDPHKLEKEVNILEAHPDVTLVHTAWQYYNEQTHAVTPSWQQPFPDAFTDGQTMLEAILTQTRMPVIHLCTSLYRTNILLQALQADEGLYRSKDFVCEDLQIAFLMAHEGTIAYVHDVTLNYSQSDGTVSNSSNPSKQFRFVMLATGQSHLLAQHFRIHSPLVDKFFSARVFALAMHAFRASSQPLYDETLKAERTWNCKRFLKTSVIFCIMNHAVLWNAALCLRKVFVAAKQVLR